MKKKYTAPRIVSIVPVSTPYILVSSITVEANGTNIPYRGEEGDGTDAAAHAFGYENMQMWDNNAPNEW